MGWNKDYFETYIIVISAKELSDDIQHIYGTHQNIIFPQPSFINVLYKVYASINDMYLDGFHHIGKAHSQS